MSANNCKTCLIVTGASRGLGRAIVEAFCESMKLETVVLVSRSNISHEIHESATSTVSADLSDLDHLNANVDKILQPLKGKSYDRIIFVNNAGSLGYIGKAIETPSFESLRSSVDFNFTSCLWLSIRIARYAQETSTADCLIVNISSLVAIQPFPTLGIYSAGKAARDSYHKVMALEGIRTLNYAPGPLETDMTEELRDSESLENSLKPAYAKQLVDPMDSAKKLVGLVLDDTFESGQHIDYYDL